MSIPLSAEPTNAPGASPTERPVSLTPACVRAIRAGRKSQLRSVAARQEGDELSPSCPLGQPGDRLWVRESWRAAAAVLNPGPDVAAPPSGSRLFYQADLEPGSHAGEPGLACHAPRTMPRWASRLELLIKLTWLERLQSIADEDLVCEGRTWCETTGQAATDDDRAGFARWWDEVHARPDSMWNANPWVWAVEFERL